MTSNAAIATTQGRTVANVTRNVEDINGVFDEYHYAMDDWDGSNRSYKEDAELRLADSLKALVQDGVSPSEIQTQMETEFLIHVRKKNTVLF